MPAPPAFGNAARAHFALHEGGTFLNHGSYGASPHVVRAEQQRLRDEMERHPDAFFDRIKPTGDMSGDGPSAPRRVASDLARLLGTEGERIALVENATAAVLSVLGSIELAAGDEILGTDHQYNAVRLGIEARCRQTGATSRTVRIPLPTNPDDIVQRVLDAVTPRTRLVVLDHITSPSALVLPLEKILPELRRRGIPVLIDGAHAIGQIPLDLPALKADWYISNAHKWLYAPRGSALLWAGEAVAAQTRPVIISHYIGRGFPQSFDYVGTRDYTAWLATSAAIDFFLSLGPEALWKYEAHLVDVASEKLLGAGCQPVGSRSLCAAMRAFVLPQRRKATAEDAESVMQSLWNQERVQIRCAILDDKLLLRVSAQVYVAEGDIVHLADALARHGWPDRS